MIPVTVITGFLGSGKTTLINGLLKHPGMAGTAVLVNEFGEIGVDHLLVEHLDEATMLIGAGCLCCSVREDVVAGLTILLERRTSGTIPDSAVSFSRRAVLPIPHPFSTRSSPTKGSTASHQSQASSRPSIPLRANGNSQKNPRVCGRLRSPISWSSPRLTSPPIPRGFVHALPR